MSLRDHDPFVIEHFNGLWDRGDDESCPSDHFLVADNVQYFESGVETRLPMARWQVISGLPLRDIVRLYNYVMQDGQSLLAMTRGGKIYHLVGDGAAPTVPIATFPDATDFGFVAIAGRAYISPFKLIVDSVGNTYSLGLQNEYVYVYHGDGSPARKAGGRPPVNGGLKPFIAYDDTMPGTVTKGFHLITVIFSPGGLYYPTAVTVVEADGESKIQLVNVPIGPPGTTSRTVVMTKAISPNDVINAGTYNWWDALVVPGNDYVDIKLDIPDAGLIVGSGWTGPYLMDPAPMVVANFNQAGFCDTGFHVVAVVYETDTGYLTSPGPEYFAANTYLNNRSAIVVYGIPVSPDPFVKKRHLVSTKTIIDYNGDQKGYQFFFIPGGTIENNTETVKIISYFDSDLVNDASHLVDNYDFIPAGVALNTYHGRMVVVGISTLPDLVAAPHNHTRPDNRSVALISASGEPEAISKVDGLIVTPLDGSPLTNAQEFRDILYLFKKTRTYAYVDNFEEPASWQEQVLDQGIGTFPHGIAAVLDSGGVNTDFLLIVDYAGLMLFNGTYSRPELTFKIEDFWLAMFRSGFDLFQIANDSIGKKIYISLSPPFERLLLYADYSNGLDAKNIKWAKWAYEMRVSSVCLIDTNKPILGADRSI